MLNKKDITLAQLRTVGLEHDEAKVYLELLRQPSTHLRLAHATGINRTKIYRLVADLEKRSLVARRSDDSGTFLTACDPTTLEVDLTTQEERLKHRRATLDSLLPQLKAVQQQDTQNFRVHTYEGVEGFKQMLWHELKTEGENLIFGSGTIGDLVDDERWAEKHRQLTVEAKYTIRELLNPRSKAPVFTLNESFKHRYTHRYVAPEALRLDNQISIYNDTVATYHWRQEQKIGVEIVNAAYAQMMRQLFEHYWKLVEIV